jgi:hypothetical protein
MVEQGVHGGIRPIRNLSKARPSVLNFAKPKAPFSA